VGGRIALALTSCFNSDRCEIFLLFTDTTKRQQKIHGNACSPFPLGDRCADVDMWLPMTGLEQEDREMLHQWLSLLSKGISY
jgi:hypothetical protein